MTDLIVASEHMIKKKKVHGRCVTEFFLQMLLSSDNNNDTEDILQGGEEDKIRIFWEAISCEK